MILLSFDTEEFDVPREHGVDFPLDEAMKVSVYGTNKILDCLKKNGVKATFFCTSNFAENAPEVMWRIMDEGHEVAAHGCDHCSHRLRMSVVQKKFWNALPAGRYKVIASRVCSPYQIRNLNGWGMYITPH